MTHLLRNKLALAITAFVALLGWLALGATDKPVNMRPASTHSDLQATPEAPVTADAPEVEAEVDDGAVDDVDDDAVDQVDQVVENVDDGDVEEVDDAEVDEVDDQQGDDVDDAQAGDVEDASTDN